MYSHSVLGIVRGAVFTLSQWFALQVQQRSLHLEPSAVTNQLSICADDSVAGNNDDHWIFVVRHADCPAGFWISNFLRNLHIALPNGRICGANRPGCASCRPRCGA